METTERTPAQSFGVLVEYNGSKWAGDAPDPLSKLFDMLKQHPLDRFWERNGGLWCLAHGSTFGGRNDKGEQIWLDTGPIYPEQPYTVRFCGNFLTYSHGFSIETDDAEVIEALHTAIAENMHRPDYLAQVSP